MPQAKSEGALTSVSSTVVASASWGGSWTATAVAEARDASDRAKIRGAGPQAWFGPLNPLQPMAPDSVGGRQWDYPFGRNLSYTQRQDQFKMLRALSHSLPILRIVIEKRKDQIKGWKWDVQPRLISKDKRKAKKPGDGEDPNVAKVRQFLRYPDRRHSFHTWLGALLEDMLVIDAATVYPRKTRGGDLYSLDFVNGETIFPLIGQDGRAPLPDDGPAYQQILHGIVAADFTLDELRYLPKNIRTSGVYGLSPVEWVVLTVNSALRREVFNLEYYNSGTIPEMFGTLPEGWTTSQIQGFQEYFDNLMSGDLARRRKLRFMPFGFKADPVRQPPMKDQYDEWLARVICAAFSIPPTPFVVDNNRATAQTIELTAGQEGIEPLQNWVKDFMDAFIQGDMGFDDLEFVWSGGDKTDPLLEAQTNQIYVNLGVKSVDEVRVELGLDPLGIGATVASAPVPLVEGYKQAVENIKNPPAPAPAPVAPALPAPKSAKAPKAAESVRAQNKAPAATKAAEGGVNAAGVMLHSPNGRVLFLLRASKGTDAGGTWAFPGGGVEDGETDEEAVVRECDEEIGFTPDTEGLNLVYTCANGYRTFAAEVGTEFKPTLNAEHDAYAWVSPTSPPQPLHPGVIETLVALDQLDAIEAA